MVDCWNRSAAAFIEEATPAPATVSQTGAGAKVGSGRGAEVGTREGEGEGEGHTPAHRAFGKLHALAHAHAHAIAHIHGHVACHGTPIWPKHAHTNTHTLTHTDTCIWHAYAHEHAACSPSHHHRTMQMRAPCGFLLPLRSVRGLENIEISLTDAASLMTCV